MNNKGQVLVTFLLMLPVVLILFMYLIDKCYLLYEKNNQINIGDIVCSYMLDSNKTDNDIKQLALENDSKLEKIKITRNNKQAVITLEKEINSIFGNILGISTYKINTKTKCTE